MSADEPYSGVAALFDGDLALRSPQYAPRQHWLIVRPDGERLALGYCPHEH